MADPFSAAVSTLFQQIASAGIWFAAAALCLDKGRVLQSERAEWRLFALAAALWGAGSAAYSLFLWDTDPAPVPSIADAFWIVFYLPAYLAISRLLRKRRAASGKGGWLDALIGVIGVGGAASIAVFDTVVADTTGPTMAVITNMAYPIGDLGLLALIVGGMTMLGWRDSGALRWMAPAFAVFAVADSLYLVMVANNSYGPNNAVDLGWPLAALLIGFAAWRAESPPVTGALKRTAAGIRELEEEGRPHGQDGPPPGVRRRWPTCRPRRRRRGGSCAPRGDTRTTWPRSDPRVPPVTMMGPLRPERGRRADGQRGRHRLGHRRPRSDAALPGEDGLHRLGDAVAPDHGRPLGQEADGRGRRGRRRSTIRGPGWRWAYDGGWKPTCPNTARLVMKAMRWRRTQAAAPRASPKDGSQDGEERHPARRGHGHYYRSTIVSSHDMDLPPWEM